MQECTGCCVLAPKLFNPIGFGQVQAFVDPIGNVFPGPLIGQVFDVDPSIKHLAWAGVVHGAPQGRRLWESIVCCLLR